MARVKGPGAALIYQIAERFKDAALVRDDSVFTPGQPIWSLAVIDDLRARFVEKAVETGDSFGARLRLQLQDAPPTTRQLMGEILYLYILVDVDTGADTKRELIAAAYPGEIPDDLSRALKSGLFGLGQARFHQFYQLAFLIELAASLKKRVPEERSSLVNDALALKAFVLSLRTARAQAEQLAFLHLIHPDHFERIIRRASKQQVVAAFRDLVSDPMADVDEQLLQIRLRLGQHLGDPTFDFWDASLEYYWRDRAEGDRADDRWGRFVFWAKRFHEWAGFDAEERNYKLAIAQKLSRFRVGLIGGSESWQDLRRALSSKENNLLNWRVTQRVAEWVESDPASAREALLQLWKVDSPVDMVIRGFIERLPDGLAGGRGVRLSLASMLLGAVDPNRYPIYRPTPFDRAFRLLDYPEAKVDLDEAALYQHILTFLDEVMEQTARRGLELRDRLDAQSVIWSVSSWDLEHKSLAEWPEWEKSALRRYRTRTMTLGSSDDGEEGLEGGQGVPLVVEAPGAAHRRRGDLGELADRLLLDEAYLLRVQRLLEAKGQVIFYGPPGTGKTYVARELAECLAGPSCVQVVQFHPSYAYEDFVEGYRPTYRDGQSRFELVQGPLRRAATAATNRPDQRHVLVIDEINRANVAKVLGELYFLLEYRKETINLQYSQEPFALPSNLWIIGTMNTADRSIALVDAALRRRFFFVPFFPDEPPVQGLLRRWLERNKPDLLWVADVVDRANELADNRHLTIGPSHFMRADLSEEWVELIWDHAILPYFAEQFFGDDERLRALQLFELRDRIVSIQGVDSANAGAE